MIFACYAGTGKTTAASLRTDTLDFLLAPYKYRLPFAGDLTYKEREEQKATEQDFFDIQYPLKYVEALKPYMDQYTYILIPTDPNVLDCLDEEVIPYILILPDFQIPEMKKIYEERYKRRGNNERFLSIFIGQWERWMRGLSVRKRPYITLEENEYVSDILERFL